MISYLPNPAAPSFGLMVEAYLEKARNYSFTGPADVAGTIGSKYHECIVGGGDPLLNPIITGNLGGLIAGLTSAFTGNKSNSEFEGLLTDSFNAYWASVVSAGFLLPHAPTVSGISNIVVAPLVGLIGVVDVEEGIPPYPDFPFFPNTMASILHNHCLAITGTYTGLVPGTPPVPTPVPWTIYTPL